MKKIILVMLTTINIWAWEINTHRAIDRIAIGKSQNLTNFLNVSGLKNYVFQKDAINFDGYNATYIEYIVNKNKGEKNGVSKWNQTFTYNQKYSYLKKAKPKELLEAGSILEDAVYKDALFGGDGRFNNHFYDPQNGGHALTIGYGLRVNAPTWAVSGARDVLGERENAYTYAKALNYYKEGFTNANPAARRKYQAKMLVSVGQLMHMVNDMNVPAHVRDDTHPFVEPLEIWTRGGENGNKGTGFRISGNTLKSYAGISRNPDNRVYKYGKFSEFITGEARWTATHFFSKDTIFTKRLPKKSDTYEELFYNGNGLEKYYIRSDSISGIPRRTKLAIRVKSYIINTLKERYYRDDSVGMGFDMSTSFRGNYSVVEENARILIPRAIANARNFMNYFFRGQISATITNNEITVTNLSSSSLLYNTATATLRPSGTYRFMYEDSNHQLHPLLFQYDVPKLDGSIGYIGSDADNSYYSEFTSRINVTPRHNIKVPIVVDYENSLLLLNKKIILVYDGDIGQERGLAVCNVDNRVGGVISNE